MIVGLDCIDSRFRFENFVRDESNSDAYKAAQMVAKGSMGGMPLVIHSGTGLGKTHLLHAIGNEALRRNQEIRVALFSTEWFCCEFILAGREGVVENFRAKVSGHYDLYLVDDLTYIDGKQLTQTELFLALKKHSKNGCGIILASCLPIDAMRDWQDEFKVWLRYGVGITEPTVEGRHAFLKECLTEKGLPADDRMIESLHLLSGTSFRELEGAVIRLQAGAALAGVKPTVDYARKVLKQCYAV